MSGERKKAEEKTASDFRQVAKRLAVFPGNLRDEIASTLAAVHNVGFRDGQSQPFPEGAEEVAEGDPLMEVAKRFYRADHNLNPEDQITGEEAHWYFEAINWGQSHMSDDERGAYTPPLWCMFNGESPLNIGSAEVIKSMVDQHQRVFPNENYNARPVRLIV